MCYNNPFIPLSWGLALSRQYHYAMDNFRALAILFVLASHADSVLDIGKAGYYLNFLFANATAWFVFISGYFFYFIESKRFQYRDFLLKKAKFLLMPYLFLSSIAMLIGVGMFDQHESLGLSLGSYLLWALIVGGNIIGPLWFMPMIMLFFMLSPIFYRLSNQRGLIIVVVIALLLSFMTFRPYNNSNPLLAMIHFMGFFWFGILVAKYHSNIQAWLTKGWRFGLLAGLGLLLFLLSGQWELNSDTMMKMGFWDHLGEINFYQTGKFGLLVVIFLSLYRYFNYRIPVMSYLANISFGLFFLHGFGLWLYDWLAPRFPEVFIDHNWSAVTQIGFIFLFSWLVIVLTQHLLKEKSRYVIGC